MSAGVRSGLAQRVLDAILNGSPETPFGRARLKAAIEARKLLIRLGDPIVRFRVGGTDLQLPLSHELPFYRTDHPLYGEAVGRIAAALRGPVVDIGANVGDTAAIIRAHTDVPLLCVEGDELFFGLLTRNVDDVSASMAFVEAPSTGHVHRERGTARVVPGKGLIRSMPLEDFLWMGFNEPALIKLDTDGMDVPILLANLRLLERLRPVLFFEYDPHLGAEPVVFDRLREIGYVTAVVYENTGEYRETVELSDQSRIAAVHAEYTGHGGARYMDVCVLPAGVEIDRDALRGPEAV